MKLQKVTKVDPMERLPISIHQSVNTDLKLYQEFYQKQTSEPISMSLMAEEMLKTFMAEDKQFQKFKTANADKKTPDTLVPTVA